MFLETIVFWWFLLAIAAAIGLFFYGLFRWASADPAIDAEAAKERFDAEQDWRGVRRSGDDTLPVRSKQRQGTP